MSCDPKSVVTNAAEALKLGDGQLIKRLIDFLGSEQFGSLLALIIKLGGLFGGTPAPAALSAGDEQKALDSSGVNFSAVSDALKQCSNP